MTSKKTFNDFSEVPISKLRAGETLLIPKEAVKALKSLRVQVSAYGKENKRTFSVLRSNRGLMIVRVD